MYMYNFLSSWVVLGRYSSAVGGVSCVYYRTRREQRHLIPYYYLIQFNAEYGILFFCTGRAWNTSYKARLPGKRREEPPFPSFWQDSLARKEEKRRDTVSKFLRPHIVYRFSFRQKHRHVGTYLYICTYVRTHNMCTCVSCRNAQNSELASASIYLRTVI